MNWSRCSMAAAVGGLLAAESGSAVAQVALAADSHGAAGSLLQVLSGRLEHTLQHIPALTAHLARLPELVGGRTALLLLGIVAAGLAAEYLVRLLLLGLVVPRFRQRSDGEGLRGVAQAALLDVTALVALWGAGRLVLGQIGDSQSLGGRLGHLALMGLLHWRVFSLLFRLWLRPAAPGLRIAPVDSATAHRLGIGLNLIILLPLSADDLERALAATGAGKDITAVANLFYATAMSLALLAIVWRWRREMAAWLQAMVPSQALPAS